MNLGTKEFSLAWRLVIWFVVVALLPLALFGYLSLRQNEELLREEFQQRMSRLADKKELQIKTYLSERVQDVQLMALSMLIEESMPSLLRAYTQYRPGSTEYVRAAQVLDKNFATFIGRSEDTQFYDVFLISPQGEIIYTYKQEADFATSLTDGPYRDSQLAEVFRDSLMTLGSSISGYAFYEPSHEPAAFISAPIVRGGRLLGVIAFQLDIQKIYRIAADNIGLGASGETPLGKLIDSQQAVFIAPLRRDPQAAWRRKIDLSTSPVPMRHALSGLRGSGIEVDYDNRQVVAAWRYLPELRWGIVVKMDADEAFAPVYRQRENLIELLVLLAMLGGFAAFYFGSQMVMRLRGFAQSADEIAAGDLDKRVDESGRDEIGALARSFNSMTTALQESYRTLEERVEQRTRELNVSNEQLQKEMVEREQADAALRENEERLQGIMNNASAAIFMKDAAGRYLLINAEYENLFHISNKEIQGKTDYDIFPEAIADALVEADNKAIHAKQSIRVEERVPLDDGIHTYISVKFPLLDPFGNAYAVCGIATDITERKRTDEQLRIAAAAFETHEAIMITDASANIIRVNQAFEKITGYSAEDVLGKNPRILSSGRQDRTFYAAMWQQLLGAGTWSGEIWDRRKDGQLYPKWLTITAVKNEQGQTTEYVAIFSDISERKEAEEEIHNLAFYDALTLLPNRRLLLDRFRLALSVSARSRHFGAVLFLDMDKFKTLNDTLGHDYGDLMLVEVARRLQSCVREVDTVARLGGDEFVVLLEEVDEAAEEASQKVALIAEKIRAVLAEPYKIKNSEHHSSPSIGVCLYCGSNESVDMLLKHADLAMYQAKESGRNAVCFFDPAMQHAVEIHAALDADLRRALPNQELHLHYQLQVDCHRCPSGAEALLRWFHPVRGMVSPAQFIPVAEESPLILDIGFWVLDTACRQLAVWAGNARTRGLDMAVNVSAHQFRRPDFVETVAKTIRAHQFDPARLKLELTESVILEDVADVVAKMHVLKALGIKLSLDDFGTGYSSLSYLKQLPIDQLKIDQSFIRNVVTDPNDAVMVQTIIDMAQNFHLSVIAEGVENEEQVGFLKQNGCISYQGYLFGKPVPIAEFEKSLGL